MAAQKKQTKSKLSLPLIDFALPLYKADGKKPLQKGDIPVFDISKKNTVQVLLAKEKDLPAEKTIAAAGIAIRPMLDTLLDTFKPVYAPNPDLSAPRFRFLQSYVSYTNSYYWRFRGDNSARETLAFSFLAGSDSYYFLRCHLFVASCRLGITVGGTTISKLLHTDTIDEGSFGFFVKTQPNGYSPDIEFFIDRDLPENEDYDFGLKSIELISTIRVRLDGSIATA